MGILDLVGLAVTAAFAVPLAVYGTEAVLRGDPVGWALLGVAALMVVAERVVTTPTDLPVAALQRLVGAVAADPSEGEDYGERDGS
ncbi:MAG: hypothetical protein ABEJ70_08525 [Halobacteriaceae archaeon]